MAGYFIYSLDGKKFQKFVARPAREQLLLLAERVSDTMDEYDNQLDDGSVMADWPSDPEALVPILQERLASDDWYAGFSDTEKDVFEISLRGFWQAEENGLGFRVDSDGVYWDVIEMIANHHGVRPNESSEKAISRFGKAPYRYHRPPGKTRGANAWFPYQSMHMPDEVRQLLEEVKAAEDTVMQGDDQNAREEYEEQLLPALEQVAAEGRVLLIVVDT